MPLTLSGDGKVNGLTLLTDTLQPGLASATDALLSMRLRAAGADNASSYHTEEIQQYSTSVSGASNPGVDGTRWRVGNVGSAYPGASAVVIDLVNPQSAANTIGFGRAHWRTAAGVWVNAIDALHHDANTAFDGFTILAGAGTITGSLRVYGCRS